MLVDFFIGFGHDCVEIPSHHARGYLLVSFCSFVVSLSVAYCVNLPQPGTACVCVYTCIVLVELKYSFTSGNSTVLSSCSRLNQLNIIV